MISLTELTPYLEKLTGRRSCCNNKDAVDIKIFDKGNGLGYSQFNEILLLLGFDRIGPNFFRYLASGDIKSIDTTINSLTQLNEGIDLFIELALQYFGNIKFAYNIFAASDETFLSKARVSLPNDIDDYRCRHNALIKIKEIQPEDSYLLGYIVQGDLEKMEKEDPDNPEFIKKKMRRDEIAQIAIRNQDAYLASDHLDIYVATSMRRLPEYISVYHTIKEVFENEHLADLKLRWFDPTQAYCSSRVDKGISEALMLKRASCTLYLAQESETLGKDSELASTLAQGKPVIAYVPIGDKAYVDKMLNMLQEKGEEKDMKAIVLEQIKIFEPEILWKDDELRGWLDKINDIKIEDLKNKLYKLVDDKYNRTAKILNEQHPLGIQVNLDSGVANGVLVVRNMKQCRELIRRVILNDLTFHIEIDNTQNLNAIDANISLRETISSSIFRTKTNNNLLTSTFWNFYLKTNKS